MSHIIKSLPHITSAETAFARLRHLPNSIWLDSGRNAYAEQKHLLSALPSTIVTANSTAKDEVDRFFKRAGELLRALSDDLDPSELLSQGSDSPAFQGGLIGYLSYDLTRAAQGLNSIDQHILPTGWMGLYHWGLTIDPIEQHAVLFIHRQCPDQIRTQVIDALYASPVTSCNTELFFLETEFVASESAHTYSHNLGRIHDYILAGDIYQANYAQHFSAQYKGAPADAYLTQRQAHPAPYSAFIDLDHQAILCHSPERFIDIQGREAKTSPIKGTAPRSSDPERDRLNAESLQKSDKDKAENLMIVDLLRNDLGRCCETGSISVPKLFELQSFSSVHHLVSEIRGKIKPDISPLDVIRLCHPGGSITGAPKRRAMEVIDELESRLRSLYCGSIGYFSACGAAKTNIAIRTMIADGEHIHCWGGGGIVADSVAEQEYQETMDKVAPLMRSLEAAYHHIEAFQAI